MEAKQETKKEKKIFLEPPTGYDDIVCEFAVCALTYLIEAWISPGCSYEFNLVYVKREQSQYLLYYNNIFNTHFQEQK